APNRVITIEWRAVKVSGSSPACSFLYNNDNRIDFQVKLHEEGGAKSNQIEIIYRDQEQFCMDLAQNFQAGLRGTDNTDFENRSHTSGNLTASSSVAGTLNTSSIILMDGFG